MSYEKIEKLELISRFEACDTLCPDSRSYGREILDVFLAGMREERILTQGNWDGLPPKEKSEIQFFRFKQFIFPIRREDVSNHPFDTRGMESTIYVEGAGDFQVDDYPFLNGVYSSIGTLQKLICGFSGYLSGYFMPGLASTTPKEKRLLSRLKNSYQDSEQFLDIYDHGSVIRSMIQAVCQNKKVLVRKSLFPGISGMIPFPEPEEIIEAISRMDKDGKVTL